jgi:hypothetical protein
MYRKKEKKEDKYTLNARTTSIGTHTLVSITPIVQSSRLFLKEIATVRKFHIKRETIQYINLDK